MAGASRGGGGNALDRNIVYGDRDDGQAFPGLRSDHGDLISTDEGDDLVHGGEGDDEIQTFRGNDRIFGGWGADLIIASVSISGGSDNVDTAAEYWIRMRSSAIRLLPARFQGLSEDHADRIYTDHGDDLIHGGAGSDLVVAYGGQNTITSDVGNDRIYSLVSEPRFHSWRMRSINVSPSPSIWNAWTSKAVIRSMRAMTTTWSKAAPVLT